MSQVRIADLPRPAVTASEVVDRETLITFVEEAARIYQEALRFEGGTPLVEIKNAFRVEGGDWKVGSIYLYVVSGGGVTLFHGTEPFREGNPTDMTRTDVNGVPFAEELIEAHAAKGGSFCGITTTTPPSKVTRTPVPPSSATPSACRLANPKRKWSSVPAFIFPQRKSDR